MSKNTKTILFSILVSLMSVSVAGAQETITYTATTPPLSTCCSPFISLGGHSEGGKLYLSPLVENADRTIRELDLATGNMRKWNVDAMGVQAWPSYVAKPTGAPNGQVGFLSFTPARSTGGLGLFNPATNGFSKFYRLGAGFTDPALTAINDSASNAVYDRGGNRLIFSTTDTGNAQKLNILNTGNDTLTSFDTTAAFGTSPIRVAGLSSGRLAFLVNGTSNHQIVLLDPVTGSGQSFDTLVPNTARNGGTAVDGSGNVYAVFDNGVLMKFDVTSGNLTKVLIPAQGPVGGPIGLMVNSNGSGVYFGYAFFTDSRAWKPATNEIITVAQTRLNDNTHRTAPSQVLVEESASTLHLHAVENGKAMLYRFPIF